MGVYAVSVIKEFKYKGVAERFANVYHYSTADGQPFLDEVVADAVVEAERKILGADTKIVQATTYGPTDQGEFANVLRETLDYNITGAVSYLPCHHAAAVLISWGLPRSPVSNRRRWLRKYLHVAYLPSDSSAEAAQGMVPLPQAAIQKYTDYAQEVSTVQGPGLGAGLELCTRLGDKFTPGTIKVHPYLGIRDLKV